MSFAGRRRLPLKASDLLLVLIVSLGASRLLGPLLPALFGDALARSREDGGEAALAFVLAALTLQTAILLLAVYLVAVRWRGVGWHDLGLVPVERRWYSRAVAIAVLTFPLVTAINAAVQALSGEPFRNPQLDLIAPAGFSWPALVGTVVVAGAFAPFVEELAFRGLLYGWLRERMGVAAGMVVSALAFSVLHGIPGLIPAIAALGIVLALVYEKSGSLWPAMVVHGTYNTVVTVGLYVALAAGVEPP